MMFFAVHKETKIRYLAATTWEGRFVDPQKEKWICPKENIISSPEEEIEVSLRKQCKKIGPVSRKEFIVVSHFFIPNKEERGIIIRGESNEHKMCNVVLSNFLQNEDFIIRCGQMEFKKSNLPKIINMSDMRESRRNVFSLKEYNRADVLLEFEGVHPYLGKGVCLETQFGGITEDERAERQDSWFRMGYSIGWFSEEDFDFSDEIPVMKENYIDVFPLSVGIDDLHRKSEQSLRETISMMMEKQDTLNKTCENTMENIIRMREESEEKIDKMVSMAVLESGINRRVGEIASKASDMMERRRGEIIDSFRGDVISALKRETSKACINCKYSWPMQSSGRFSKPETIRMDFVNCWFEQKTTGEGRPAEKANLESCEKWQPKSPLSEKIW